MEVKLTKTNYFIISSILFFPLLVMMFTWFMTVYVFFTLKYYPIDINNRLIMNQYYRYYEESKANALKYKVLLLGLDGIQEEGLNPDNNPYIMHKALNPNAPDYWDSINRFKIPDHWSNANVEAAVRGGTINWEVSKYEYSSESFFTPILQKNANIKASSIQLHYEENILAINNNYIEPETLQKMDAKELPWNAEEGVNDSAGIYNLYLDMIDAINSNHHLVFGFDTLSDEVAHHGWTIHSKKYQYSLWIQSQYVKAMQDLLAKRTTEFNEKWMFVLFTDHGRDRAFDGQHHQLDSNSLKAWFYTNQPQEQIEQWIKKDADSDQRGLIDIKSIISGYLSQN